jgi:hypothetical protein
MSAFALAVVLVASSPVADPPVVTELHLGDRLSRADLLKPSVHRFIRYTVTPDGHRKPIDIWSREIRFETKDGRRLMHVHQQWDEVSPPLVRLQDAWFEADTLKPTIDIRHVVKDGKTTTAGYRFLPDQIVGLNDLAENVRKDFKLKSAEPAYDWEIDQELLQALPLGPGYSVSINFYDPGQDPPARYTYKVIGSEEQAGADGHPIDCWVVKIDFVADKAWRRFWFAKKTHQLVHEETNLADGTIIVKSLLEPEAGDGRS